MGCKTCFSVIVLFVSLAIGYIIYILGQIPEVPKIEVEYWGPGLPKKDDATIKPFKINISDTELKYFQERLASSRELTPPLEGVAFNYGINTEYLNKFVEFWKKKYNWRDREAYLNSFPQFVTQIGGLNIHFLHVKPDPKKAKGKEVLPLILLHGWPGSVREFYELIPLLTTPRPDSDFVFEVVAPSLPGYGFSEGASKPGLGPAHIGVIFNELMIRLGFQKYYVQGGDWGSLVGFTMSILFPQRVVGYHSNFCFPQTLKARYRTFLAYFFPSLFMKEKFRDKFRNQFVDTFILESGYFHIQATKPDTVGVGLTDSPVGLAAYILEKFSTWTDKAYRNLPDGGLEAYNKAELLDNIMIYWFSKSITTSARFYSEADSNNYRSLQLDHIPMNVPAACAVFPNELLYYPPAVLEAGMTDLVSVTEMPAGGHFAAFEHPKLLADDIWDFLLKLKQRVKGKK